MEKPLAITKHEVLFETVTTRTHFIKSNLRLKNIWATPSRIKIIGNKSFHTVTTSLVQKVEVYSGLHSSCRRCSIARIPRIVRLLFYPKRLPCSLNLPLLQDIRVQHTVRLTVELISAWRSSHWQWQVALFVAIDKGDLPDFVRTWTLIPSRCAHFSRWSWSLSPGSHDVSKTCPLFIHRTCDLSILCWQPVHWNRTGSHYMSGRRIKFISFSYTHESLMVYLNEVRLCAVLKHKTARYDLGPRTVTFKPQFKLM